MSTARRDRSMAGGLVPPVLLSAAAPQGLARTERTSPMTDRGMRLLEPAVRRLLQRWWRWQRALTIGTRAMVVDGDGRLMLLRHTYVSGWMFPGGGVEWNELVETAMLRELHEEAGVSATAAPELFGLYSNHEHFPGDHVAFFVVRQWTQTPPDVPNREIAEIGFFAPTALPAETTPGTLRRIDEVAGRRPRASVW